MKPQKSTFPRLPVINQQLKKPRASFLKPILMTLILLTLSQTVQSHIFWMPTDADLGSLQSPLEILPRFNRQIARVVDDFGIAEKVLRVGLKYQRGRPIYLIVIELQMDRKMYFGAEYKAEADWQGKGEFYG